MPIKTMSGLSYTIWLGLKSCGGETWIYETINHEQGHLEHQYKMSLFDLCDLSEKQNLFVYPDNIKGMLVSLFNTELNEAVI